MTDPYIDPQLIDATTPQAARRYDYWIGGKDNFAADRAAATQLAQAYPGVVSAARENRKWMQRVVRWLADDAGLQQFLDIGAGISHPPNVHQIAQAVDESARVIYVDNDAMVAVHARGLMTSPQDPLSVFIDGDLRHPQAIIKDAVDSGVLDFAQPIGLLLIAVAHFVPDDEELYPAVEHLVQALPAGSYLALSHVSYDLLDAATASRLRDLERPEAGQGPFQARTQDQVSRLFTGLDMVEPGLVPIVDWHGNQHPQASADRADVAVLGGVARKPGEP